MPGAAWIMRSRMTSVGSPSAPAPRRMRSTLYCCIVTPVLRDDLREMPLDQRRGAQNADGDFRLDRMEGPTLGDLRLKAVRAFVCVCRHALSVLIARCHVRLSPRQLRRSG